MTNARPLSDAEGNVRELDAEDFAWFVSVADFPSEDEMRAFLLRRSAILSAAERAGIPRSAFLGLEPSRPDFERRVREAFGAVLSLPALAAE